MTRLRWFDVVAVLALMGCTAVMAISILLGWQIGSDVKETAAELRVRILNLEADSLKRDMHIIEEVVKMRKAFEDLKQSLHEK